VAYNGLEPDDAKVSCPVLRGRKGGNTLSYPIQISNLLILDIKVLGEFDRN
jgi:hypothetical protein